MPEDPDRHVNETIRWFSQIYLGGIPSIITNDSAFLSFVCIVTATEALSGYRYSHTTLSIRFPRFIENYFPETYHPYAKDLYEFRKKIVHAMSTARFALTHHHSELHLGTLGKNNIILNAEDFYAAFLLSAQKYFTELRGSPELKTLLIDRLNSFGGGSITVLPVTVFDHEPEEGPSGEKKT
jgi:hypothetical protein